MSETSPVRRHFLVLGIAVLGLILGIVLVVTGRDDHTSTPATTVTYPSGPLLDDLGVVTNLTAAKALVGSLDPSTLRPSKPSPTSSTRSATTSSLVGGVDLTSAGLKRCSGAIAQQNVDRSLGKSSAAARLVVGAKPTFVVSYALPASGSLPAGTRMLIVDARTCRVLGAVQH